MYFSRLATMCSSPQASWQSIMDARRYRGRSGDCLRPFTRCGLNFGYGEVEAGNLMAGVPGLEICIFVLA